MTSSYLSRYLKNEKNALTPNKPGDTKLKTFYLDKEGNQVEKTISPPSKGKEDYPEDDRGAYKKGGKVKKLASGGFPDLNDDGKVTKADVLKGRGVPGFKGGKWIQEAIKKPGALRKSLGVKGDKPIPAGKLAKAAKAPGKLGQRARLAQTLKKMK